MLLLEEVLQNRLLVTFQHQALAATGKVGMLSAVGALLSQGS